MRQGQGIPAVASLVRIVHKPTVTLLAKPSSFKTQTKLTNKGNSMRFFAIVLTLSALMMPVIAQQNFKATAKKITNAEAAAPTNCTAATHSHRYSDMRLAIVEITEADTCGFDYINLEDNTIGLDNHFQYGEDFLVTRAAELKPDLERINTPVLTRKAIHRGTRGIAVYCGTCKALMMLKVTNE